MKLYCYPVLRKQKSVDICRAFAEGCGLAAEVVTQPVLRLFTGPAFFWGVDESNAHLWHEARDTKHQDYYYGDNSYFDPSRGDYYRVTFNHLQHSGNGWTNCVRLARLGIEIKPWREEGGHIVVCPQSDFFMRQVVGYHGNWLKETVTALRDSTDREIVVRDWNGDKKALSRTLGDDLKDAHCLITWSSAAAITSVLAGVPAVSMGQSAASAFNGTESQNLEELPKPEWRYEWAGVLADNQWTIEEMRGGACWEGLRKNRINGTT